MCYSTALVRLLDENHGLQEVPVPASLVLGLERTTLFFDAGH